LINEHFDLRPAGIIQSLNLRRPIYQPTAAFGHFGRTDIDAPWEALDKVPMLRKGVGANLEMTGHEPGLALTQGEMLE
jgi:S-adenosylmethionine synthetase